MRCTRPSSWEDLLRQWCGSHTRLSPPPPKPPDRSLQQNKMELQVTRDRSMLPPHRKPP
ncbi:hypothetical protein A2U01_0113229, partial [Trifolium medium]|nr:hypothetical protein [Trifolium medium]